MVHSKLILVEGGNNGAGENGWADNSKEGLKIAEEIKVDIIAYKNESRTRIPILINFYFNIALFIKTYNIQSIMNRA